MDAYGEWPAVEAIVSLATSRMFNLDVGDLVTVTQDIGSPNRIYAVIAGVFTATEPTEDYWLFHASTLIDPHVDEEDLPEEIDTPYDPAEPAIPLFISENSMVDGLGEAFPGVMVDSMWFVFIDKEGLKGLEIPEVRGQPVRLQGRRGEGAPRVGGDDGDNGYAGRLRAEQFLFQGAAAASAGGDGGNGGLLPRHDGRVPGAEPPARPGAHGVARSGEGRTC